MLSKLVLLAFVATSAATTLRPPSFSDSQSCGFLPRKLPAPLLAPPDQRVSEDVLCDSVKCPKAPNSCFEDSVCVWGQCMPFQAKADYTPCNDYDSTTVDDVCSAGVCKGVKLTCPDDIVVTPTRSTAGPQAVSWEEPKLEAHDSFFFSTSSSHRSGDLFDIGATEVSYQAVDSYTNEEYSCSFKVEVLASEHPCDGVVCEVDNICQASAPTCKVIDAMPVCPEPTAVRNGDYDREALYRSMGRPLPPRERFADSFRQFNTVKCHMGQSWCEGKLRLLPKRLPKPPMAPPSFDKFQAPRVVVTSQHTTTRAVTTRATTRATTTTVRTTTVRTTTVRTTTRAATRATTTAAPFTTTPRCEVRVCRCKATATLETWIDENGCEDCSCRANPTTTTARPTTTTARPTTTTTTTTAKATTVPTRPTTQSPYACTTRTCNCKPGSVVETFINEFGCEDCSCKASRRRLLAEESIEVDDSSSDSSSMPTTIVMACAVIAAVVLAAFVVVKKASSKQQLPLVSTASNFKPLDAVSSH